jgi:hypothetical protein
MTSKNRKLSISVLISLVVLSSLALTISPVYSETYQAINVMVAYDEEWAHTALWLYGYKHPENFCWMFIDWVSWRFEEPFGIRFIPVRYVFWDSNDSLTEDITDLLNECIEETGFYTGMPFYGKPIDVLIAFTDQHTSSGAGIDYGKALPSLGAVIVVEEYHLLSGVQYTDNILQHELTHLYKIEEDWVCPKMPGYNCVMNYWPIYVPWPEDTVRPYGMTTESWCGNCSAIINCNKAKWGRLYEEHTGGSLGFLVPEGGFIFEQ